SVEPDYLALWFPLELFTCLDRRNGRSCVGRLRTAQNSVGRSPLCCRFPCSFPFDRPDFWDVISEDDSPYLSACHPQGKLLLQPDADSFFRSPRPKPWFE